MASPPEEQRDREDSPATKEMLHKTKLIQFLGRNTSIILQNDNGPCPLLAICNVLSLRNNLNLSADVAEVSQEKLLSLVAERLIDSNSNVNNKDAGYVENQQQNIADAIDLLPRLTTGIDVNLKFTRIDDFEFTRECAIFDLLDIPLYHGWIVDPQDSDTFNAIGLKSYNTIMGELVALETQNQASDLKNTEEEEDCVDFVAATTASLGVPSPSLSRNKSFDDSSNSVSDDKKERKGDIEEEKELLEALKLSETENDVNTVENNPCEISNEPENDSAISVSDDIKERKGDLEEEKELLKALKLSETKNDVNAVNAVENNPSENSNEPKNDENNDNNAMKKDNNLISFETVSSQDVCSSSLDDKIETQSECKDEIEKCSTDVLVQSETVISPPVNTRLDNSGDEKRQDESKGNDVNLQSLNEITQPIEESEPIYEGEEHIQETSTANYENQEPVYEGEVVLAEQVDKVSSSENETKGKIGITPKQGELIRNFLKNSASQLTIYGLFALQESIKERELCVFFRNNHFNTMFKFEGELYLLATDQGYINQPDLVWEKLNEVNGDTVYMTGSFKEFNPENPPEPRSWDEQNALANTAEYLASIDNAAQDNTGFNSDLQLAIALQQQEFEQQPPHQQPPQQLNSPQPNTSGESGLVTGPQHVQPSRPKNSSNKESKSSKEKCTVM